MPDDSDCFPKFGMYNEITEQFVSDRENKEGLRWAVSRCGEKLKKDIKG